MKKKKKVGCCTQDGNITPPWNDLDEFQSQLKKVDYGPKTSPESVPAIAQSLSPHHGPQITTPFSPDEPPGGYFALNLNYFNNPIR